jgi:hypothetical protein
MAALFTLRFSEIARVLLRFDNIASRIINANHGVMRGAEKLRYPIVPPIRLTVRLPLCGRIAHASFSAKRRRKLLNNPS